MFFRNKIFTLMNRYVMLNNNKSIYIPIQIINKLLNINYKYISNKIFIKHLKNTVHNENIYNIANNIGLMIEKKFKFKKLHFT